MRKSGPLVTSITHPYYVPVIQHYETPLRDVTVGDVLDAQFRGNMQKAEISQLRGQLDDNKHTIEELTKRSSEVTQRNEELQRENEDQKRLLKDLQGGHDEKDERIMALEAHV